MAEEVNKPSPEEPSLEQHIEEVSYPIRETAWLRKAGTGLGVDTERYILGSVLDYILGDDANILLGAKWRHDMKVGKNFNILQRQFETRLEWESGVPEVPGDLRERLEGISKEIKDLDWSEREQFNQAEAVWTKFRNELQEEVTNAPRLLRARLYYVENSRKVRDLFRETKD